MLNRRLGDPDALDADHQAGIVHERKHAGEAVIRRAHQPAERIGKIHHAGRAAVNSQFVLHRYDADAVGLANRTRIIDEPLGYGE